MRKLLNKSQLLKLLFLSFLSVSIFSSCNEDSIDEIVSDEDTMLKNISDINLTTRISTPCDFTLSGIQSNTTISLNCVLNLKGKTFNLPSNVNFDFGGGDIINGTLKFSSGTIDGRLLNSTLKIKGNVKLKDQVFNFEPRRWEIEEGQTTSTKALQNRDMLENSLELVKELGGTQFKIDELDAYFEVSKATYSSNFYAGREAINVPSNMDLYMTINTHLRVFPNNRKQYALLAVRNATNVNIYGGVLHGDRDQHTYSGGTHEWGYIIYLRGASNTTVTGTIMKDGTGDGMKIQGINFSYSSNYIPTKNVVIKDCVFDNNRRNNMSITGGYNVTVENNIFQNAGAHTNKSKGTAPGYGIDIEATRTRNSNGTMRYYEKTENIFIKNNVFENSRKGAITVAIGYDVVIENNKTQGSISYSLANGVRIRNNHVIANTNSQKLRGTGIKAGRKNSSNATVHNNEVSGNIVEGYGTGIYVSNRDVVVKGNKVNEFKTGIRLTELKDAKITNNVLKSKRYGSYGIFMTSTFLDDVIISHNDVSVMRNPMKFYKVNYKSSERNYNLLVDHNNFKSPGIINFNYSQGINFTNNQTDHGIEVFNSKNLNFSNNTINAYKDNGFDIRKINNDIKISNNTIAIIGTTRKKCIRIETSTRNSEVIHGNNNCAD